MTRRTLRAVPLVVAILAAVAAPAAAQSTVNSLAFGLLIAEQSRPSFSIIGAGARAAGMGGAFTALADDASAASFNPAGLALLLLPEVSVVGSGQRHRESYTSFVPVASPSSSSYDDTAVGFDTGAVNFAALTLPFTVARRNLCVQLSYQQLIDFSYDGERSFYQRAGGTPVLGFRQSVRQSGDIATLSLALAYQLTQRLSLGATLSHWDGDWVFSTYDEARDVTTTHGGFLSYQQRNRLEGWSLNVGGLLRYRYLNLGATYRFGFDGDYRFASSFTTDIPTSIELGPPVKATLHWPSSWTAGIAIKPSDDWHVTADYARYNWSAMEIRGLGDAGRTTVNFFDLEPSAQTATRDIHQWRFGTEYTFFAGHVPLALRGGYFRDEQPAKLLEAAGRNSSDGYSAGAGIKLGQLSIDVAYQRRSWTAKTAQFVDPRVIENSTLKSIAIGDKQTDDRRVLLSLLYQFPNDSGVNRVLRWLFVAPDEAKGGDGA